MSLRAGPPTTSTRAGAAPLTHPFAHFTGAGFFLINTHGWLAGAGEGKLWQDFRGRRDNNESPIQTVTRELREETGIDASTMRLLAPPYRVHNDQHVYVIHIARGRGRRVADEVKRAHEV